MEDRKNTNSYCQNNYTEETFFESFGRDDEDVKKCNNCPHMVFDGGIMSCSKFCRL